MEVSDEIINAILDAHWGDVNWRNFEKIDRDRAIDWATKIARAALAVMPEQYRAEWIAGRDAAAEHVCGYCVRQNSICADHIRNMEPPA